MCFMAGANSIFYGDKLLTTGNPDVVRDQELFARLGLKAEGAVAPEGRGDGCRVHAKGAADQTAAALSASIAV
jgi:biotin synthase